MSADPLTPRDIAADLVAGPGTRLLNALRAQFPAAPREKLESLALMEIARALISDRRVSAQQPNAAAVH